MNYFLTNPALQGASWSVEEICCFVIVGCLVVFGICWMCQDHFGGLYVVPGIIGCLALFGAFMAYVAVTIGWSEGLKESDFNTFRVDNGSIYIYDLSETQEHSEENLIISTSLSEITPYFENDVNIKLTLKLKNQIEILTFSSWSLDEIVEIFFPIYEKDPTILKRAVIQRDKKKFNEFKLKLNDKLVEKMF